MGRRYNDLTGRRFGRLIALSRTGKVSKSLGYYWNCICDCGNTKIVAASSLLSGSTKSCGCLLSETSSERIKQTIAKPLPDGISVFNGIYNQYKAGARKRGILFELNKDEFRSVISNNCAYCGAPPKARTVYRLSGNVISNGVDRIDSNKGYTLDNVVPCCAMCNKAKNDLSVKDFLKMVESIYNHSIRK